MDWSLLDARAVLGQFLSSAVPYIIHVPGGPVLPAEVDERVVRLLDVHRPLAFVWRHHIALQGHFAGTELHQVFAGASSGAAHHAWEESAGRHHEVSVRLLKNWTTMRTNPTGMLIRITFNRITLLVCTVANAITDTINLEIKLKQPFTFRL